ncbi:MAG: TadE/TadG family type IV pilus assembly protein [Saccharofermentanales bacterium]
MSNRLKHFAKNEKGQAIVELAIAIPVLLLVLCGIIDFGWIFSNKMVITYCSREGARYGTVNAAAQYSEEDIAQRVMDVAPDYLKDNLNVAVTYTDIYDVRSGDVEVEVRYTVRALTPITGIFFDNQEVELVAVSIMKVE